MTRPRTGDTVKVHYTGRLDDGRVFDSSQEKEPLELTVGESQVIPGFEAAVVEMELGETKTVTVPAEQAFGPRQPERVLAVDRAQFPDNVEPAVGQRLQVRHDDGRVTEVSVSEVSADRVTLDANHPLAGQDLTFDLELLEVNGRKA